MTLSGAYRRVWSTVAAVATAALAVLGVVASGPSHLLALGSAAAATSLAGTVWAATTAIRLSSDTSPDAGPDEPRPPAARETVARRAAALPPTALLAVVGVGHTGPLAALAVVLLLVTCPWLLAIVHSHERGRGSSL